MTMPEQSADPTGSGGLDREIKFLVHSPGAWGNGATLEEAKRNCPGGGSRAVVYMWPGPELPNKAWAGPGGLSWEGTNERPILIQDTRLAKDKKAVPLEIGTLA